MTRYHVLDVGPVFIMSLLRDPVFDHSTDQHPSIGMCPTITESVKNRQTISRDVSHNKGISQEPSDHQ